ncbi:Vacuolar fusion protein mon1 [Serendipita sp. 401]|nr:Vacuolar fusion protein mon1 [Serendipita sp. 401]
MSHTPRRSRSKHGTPTPSRPGTPSGSHRRPSFVQQTSIPSLALANASLSSTVSAPQVSTSQAITISGAGNNNNDHPEQSSVPTSSNVSLYESTANESVLVDVRNDSNEQVHIVVEQTVGSSDVEGEGKAQDGVTLDANKLREQLRQSLGKARAQSKSYSQKEGVAIRTDIRDVDYDSPSQQQRASSKEPTVHRQFFVLTHAGKPVFTNRSEDDVDAEDVTNLIGDFETVRQWADVATSRLKENDTLKQLIKATQKSSYSITDLGIPGLRHFFYKSRPNVQVTSPMFEGLGESLPNEKEDDGTRDGEEESKESRAREEWEKLLNLYRVVWDAIHAKSGQECTLKLQYLRTDTVSVMGWITQSFEIYVALSPLLPKSAAIGAANAVVKYIKQEESRLFLRDAPVF